MSELKLIKAMWGVPALADPAARPAMLARVVCEGHVGVRISATQWRDAGVMADLKAAGLAFVAQIHTTAHVDDGAAGFQYMTEWGVDEHLKDLRAKGAEAVGLGCMAINAHSGVDGWSLEEGRRYLRVALAIEAELGVPVFHETHRRRLFWNPFQTRDLLAGQADLAGVKLNADLSHWVMCLERCWAAKASWQFNSDKIDPWWPEVLALLQKHCGMIHARVAHREGSQVADPAAPEYADELAAHLYYWGEIVKGQAARGCVSIIEPEHGPWPYQQSAPYTDRAPTHDIWEANRFVKCRVQEEFAGWVGAAEAAG